MPSIIEGYNYDIFISYRQKDNKGDRWVSEFVEALKTELESTFKEEISVYFDINPHDGLSEVHDVDASLKEKLKCLIFIPIISRTYCDPKSFAWDHEFMAFISEASENKLGLKVRLPNGNVISRVLPVKIHDLNPEDKTLVEKVIGGHLRSIEFIYKELGVNRPLTQKDDEGKNLNNTIYRNQINKVANAVEEIIQGLKGVQTIRFEEKHEKKDNQKIFYRKEKHLVLERLLKSDNRRLLGGITFFIILTIASILVYSKIFNRNNLESYRSESKISVAIMPFQNNTIGAKWEKSQGIIQFILKNSLSSNEEIIVRDIESTNYMTQDKGVENDASLTISSSRRISKKLDADVFIVGSIIQAGNKLRLQAELIDSKTGVIFKGFHKEGAAMEENIIQMTDSLQLDIKNFLLISLLGKNIPSFQKKATLTHSPEALEEYLSGDKAFFKRENLAAITHYKNAIAIDSNFLFPIIRIGFAYSNENLYAESKEWASKAIQKVDQMDPFLKNYAYFSYSLVHGRILEAIKYRKELIKIDDQNPANYFNIGYCYNWLEQYDNAIPYLEKALEIFRKMDLRPYWSRHYISLGTAYHKTGQFKKERRLYKKAEKDFPEDIYLTFSQGVLELSRGSDEVATKYIEKYISLCRENSIDEAEIKTAIANMYLQADLFDKAEGYYRNALSLDPENYMKLNDLAYSLVENNQKIDEGLALVDKALKISPDNYESLYINGRGLYKLGNFKAALELLQKSWDIRMEKANYNHEAFLHLEEAKKAVANQTNI